MSRASRKGRQRKQSEWQCTLARAAMEDDTHIDGNKVDATVARKLVDQLPRSFFGQLQAQKMGVSFQRRRDIPARIVDNGVR